LQEPGLQLAAMCHSYGVITWHSDTRQGNFQYIQAKLTRRMQLESNEPDCTRRQPEAIHGFSIPAHGGPSPAMLAQ
jgi:hypothetical protein